MRTELLDRITANYLESRDFNGISWRTLKQESPEGLLAELLELVRDGLITAQFGSVCLNPAIIRLGVLEIEAQLAKLEDSNERGRCFLYPSRQHLATAVSADHLADQPYRRLLALGEPQLAVRSFDLSVLEVYRNDPRYHYWCDDMHGYISISDQYYESDDVAEHDQVFLETFGFSYDEEFNRGVASFVC